MQQNAVRSTQQILTLQQLLLLFDICSSSTYCSCYFDIVVNVCVSGIILWNNLYLHAEVLQYIGSQQNLRQQQQFLLLIFGIIIVYLAGIDKTSMPQVGVDLAKQCDLSKQCEYQYMVFL